jgi:hypothetical protein
MQRGLAVRFTPFANAAQSLVHCTHCVRVDPVVISAAPLQPNPIVGGDFMTTTNLVAFLVTALAAGVLGGFAMELVLWSIGHAGWAKADMVVALGSLLTRSRVTAWRVGALVHTVAAIAFAILYALLMVTLGYSGMPDALMFGLAVGFFHGLVVSLGLGWVVATRHPLEEFQEAGFAVCLSHIIGHVAYGAVVGLVVGFSPI